MMSLRNERGQNIVEYAVLFALVVAAFVTIQVYAKRGLQARVMSATDALATVGGKIDGPGGVSADFKTDVAQYEPYYSESDARTYTENVEQEHMGGGRVQKEKVSDVQARAAGAYQRQRTVNVGVGGGVDRDTADNLWK